jgi:hypothetical protein
MGGHVDSLETFDVPRIPHSARAEIGSTRSSRAQTHRSSLAADQRDRPPAVRARPVLPFHRLNCSLACPSTLGNRPALQQQPRPSLCG